MTQTKKRTWKNLTIFSATLLLLMGLSGCMLDENIISQSTQPTQTILPTTTQPPVETTPPDPIKGTVTTKELKIRSGVGDFHEEIGLLKEGDIVEILEQTQINGISWGRIQEGWINLSQVHLKGQMAAEDESSENFEMNGAITGTVIAEELNLRSGPGTKYKVVKSLKLGDSITITEMNGTWGKTEDGWLNTIFAYFPDTLDKETIHAIVTADILNVRAGPSTSYESLLKLETGAEVTIIKQVVIRNIQWGYMGEGWICMDYVEK